MLSRATAGSGLQGQCMQHSEMGGGIVASNYFPPLNDTLQCCGGSAPQKVATKV
jgi:hypothetical protein